MSFEPSYLPLAVKEQLCRSLLEELGVVSVRHLSNRAELIHGCLVSPEMHGDQARNPTASLNYEKLTFSCLGCQAKGGILWLITRIRRCTWEEARLWLSGEVGTSGTVMPLAQLLEYYDALYEGASRRAEPIPAYAMSTLDPWLAIVHPWLTTGVPELEVTGRGIPEQNAIDLKLGWDPEDDTIVIPHIWEGSLAGWQKRRLSGDGPKYKSTAGMPRDRTLYDYDAKRRTAVIVESPMSVARHRHALPMEATFGASVTDRQIRLIAAHYEGVVLWMDNDEAGWRALEGSGGSPGMIERLAPYISVRVVDSPLAGDPADVETPVAVALVNAASPGVIWAPPTTLGCPKCLCTAHSGACEVFAA